MGKPVAGDVVVVPFPNADLSPSKRRPALVVADLPGDDLILCQITSVARSDNFAIALSSTDFVQGQLKVDSFIRPHRLFTADQSVILYTICKLNPHKLNQVRSKARQLFA